LIKVSNEFYSALKSDNVMYICVISAFCRSVNKTFDLMGC